MYGFVVFIAGHVVLVAMTGFARNINHIVMGTEVANLIGLYLGVAGIVIVAVRNSLAYFMAWKYPRAVQIYWIEAHKLQVADRVSLAFVGQGGSWEESPRSCPTLSSVSGQ